MGDKPQPQEKRSMKLNDFVLSNNKARSVMLNARNLQQMQEDTVSLATESKDMEEKLQLLKNNMCKEKAERGHSRPLRWAYGQNVFSNSHFLPNNLKKNKDNKIQKLSAGKVKIRVLKDESLTAPSQPQPSPSFSHADLRVVRRGKQKEQCRQCGVSPAGLMCSECNENHCTDCFSSCHQKETLKLHSAIPSQVFVKDSQEEKVGVTKDKKKGLGYPPLRGKFNEEEFARSFGETLIQWRGEERDGGEQTMTMDGTQKPARTVLLSATATQADLPPDREAEGQRREGPKEKLTVKVEFTESSLTYMDRLLLKKHHRAPIESHPSLDFGIHVKSLTTSDPEETISSLTAGEEEDFHNYCASLFTVPASRRKTEPQIHTPETLVIEILNEERETELSRDTRVYNAEQKTENREGFAFQQFDRRKQTLMSNTAKKLHLADRQSPKPEQSVKDLPSKSSPAACPLFETSERSKESVKTPTLQSPMSFSSHSVHKLKAKQGSPQILSPLPHLQSGTPRSSQSPGLFLADLSTLDGNLSEIPKEHISSSLSTSFSLRSTFRVSPLSSTQSNLLPKVFHSALQQKVADSSPLSEGFQSSQLFAETISSLELCEAPAGNLFSPQQFQHSLSDPELLGCPSSPVSARPQPPPKSLKPVLSINSHTQCCGVAYSHSMPPLKFGDIINNLGEMDEDKELPGDSEDEMSSDSLSLAPHEDNSSSEEAQMQECLTRTKSIEKEDRAVASRLEGFFVQAEADTETDLHTDTQEQQTEPLMVMQQQSAGPGSELFCDLDEFLPLGLDTNTSHSNSPEYELCDQSHSGQHSVCDSASTVVQATASRSCAGEHLVHKEMKNIHTQPMGIQMHSTRREEMSANDLGTSEARSNLLETSTPILTDSPRRNSRLTSTFTSHCVSHSPSPTLHACLSNNPSGSGNSPSFRPHSSAAQEIMEICSVDQTGCEDPDMDAETTKHMLHILEQELKLMANAQHTCTRALDRGNSGFQNENQDRGLKWGGVSEEQNEEEEAAESDRQSVLLLP